MRFWAKGKQGEKKTTRVKPTTQSEVSPLFTGADVIPAHQFPDGKSDERVELMFIISVHSFRKFAIPVVFIMSILLAGCSNEIGPALLNPSLTKK